MKGTLHLGFSSFAFLLFILSIGGEPNPGIIVEFQEHPEQHQEAHPNPGDIDPTKEDVGAVLINTVHSALSPNSTKIPEIEIKKLKAAVKGTGLPDAKVDRVMRAVRALDLKFNEVVDLKKVMMNPSTTTDYAERVRRALEDALVDKHVKMEAALHSPAQDQQQPHKTLASPIATADPKNPLSGRDLTADDLGKPLDAATLKRIQTVAELSGVNKTTSTRLARAIMNSELQPQLVHQLGDVIQTHAASPEDLHKFIDHLEETDFKSYRKRGLREGEDGGQDHDDNFPATPEQAEGIDWIYNNQNQ